MEFLIELLVQLFLEVFLEAAIEIVGEAILVFVLTATTEALGPSELRRPVWAGVGYVLLGATVGGLSLIWFPFPLVHPSRFHGISLIVSPVLTGSLMALLGSILRKYDMRTVNLETFSYGFLFAFGMTLVRFLFAR